MRGKKPKAEIQIGFVLYIGEDKPRININLPHYLSLMVLLMRKIDTVITPEFIADLKKGEMVSIGWDEGEETKLIRF